MNEIVGEPKGVERFSRRDWGAVILSLLVAFLLRVPVRSHMAYHWDSAQFVLAIKQYDMRVSQPHPPGYFLYVMLGRLVNHFIGDPHASLVWISVVFGSALPAIVYLIGTAMFGRWAGATAGLMALTSPQVWFHGCVALTYVVDSFLVCAMVLLLWQAMRHGGQWRDALVIGALLAVIGGVREQSVVALAPLILFAFWRFECARTAKLAVAMLLATGLGLAWFVPMVRTSGGLGTYLKLGRLHAALNAPDTFGGGGIEALLNNVAGVSRSCWNGLVLGAGILVVALLYRVFRMTAERKSEWHRQHAHALSFLGMWVVPMMLLGTVIGFTKQPGYVLGYLPGWFVLTGAVAASLQRAWQRGATLAAICAVNVVVFAAWPPQWDGIFFGMGRTARDISEHDAQLSRIVASVRRTYLPTEAVICHADEYYLYGLRHFQLYLPEYDQYQLAIDMTTLHPPGKPMWRVRDGRLEFVDKLPMDGGKEIVLFVPPGEDVAIFAPYFSPATLDCLAKRAIR